MKKSLFTLVFGLLISVTAVAQSNLEKHVEKSTDIKIERIEASLKFQNDEEKEKFATLTKEQLTRHFNIGKKYKKSDPEMCKQKRRDNNKQYNKELQEAFGTERAKALFQASKK